MGPAGVGAIPPARVATEARAIGFGETWEIEDIEYLVASLDAEFLSCQQRDKNGEFLPIERPVEPAEG